MRSLLLLTLVGAALVPAAVRAGQRIVGGSDSSIEQYPFLVNMHGFHELLGVWWFTCGAVLLNELTLLSAAHCYTLPARGYRATVGTNYHSASDGVHHPVARYVLHPGFTREFANHDLAVLHLAAHAALGPRVQLARLAGPGYSPADLSPVTAVGWGALFQGGPAKEELQEVGLHLFNQEVCALRYAYLKSFPQTAYVFAVAPDMMCAGTITAGYQGVCQGDSGGPLLHDGVVVGINSWGFVCGHDFYPGVFARVSYNIQWITDNI